VALEVERGIGSGYDFIAVNFANGDVIGHTASFEAKVAAAEAVDAALARVAEAALAAGYAVFVTADHGNIEEGFKADGTPHIAHTTNAVPFVVLDRRDGKTAAPRDGRLADVAPTILEALGVPKPTAMTGTSLLPDRDWGERRRALLVVMDGWGIGRDDARNPISIARTPYWDSLAGKDGVSRLAASGAAVGLKEGKPGNSEAGHLNIGAGRVVPQDDVRLDAALKDGSFARNETFASAIDVALARGRRLHLIGLLSERSSHGSIEYPLAIARMARERGLADVFIHVILDGRSTEPGSAPAMLEELGKKLEEIGAGVVVTAVGRGIALDRGGDYGKIKKAYGALVSGIGRKASIM
jgi:2,3-bisphosphoglycerate-independent phosphoglycerate mutase